jgi:hypothetical protein
MTEREKTLKVARIISIAITLGPAIFFGVVFYLLKAEGSEFGRGESAPMISYASLAMAIAAIGASVVVPRLLRSRVPEPLAGFQAAVVVRAAILEAPALLGCVAYLLEGKQTPVGAGVAIAMILLLAGSMPTGPRLDAWLSE